MSTLTALQAEAARDAAEGMDRRRSQREAYVATASLSAEAGAQGPSQQVIVIDLSLHGVGFTCDQPVQDGATHWIVIGAGGLRASSRVRIVFCRARRDGGFDCGAEFF